MKLRRVFAAIVLGGSPASATTTAVAHNHALCTSSSKVTVAVTQERKSIGGARVDVYIEIGNGERTAWTGVTDDHGLVTTPELKPGKYRVFVDSGNDYGTIALDVTGDSRATGTVCDLQFATPPKPESEILADLATNAPTIQLKEFRGVMQDENGAVIPNLKIRIFRKGAFGKSIAEIETGTIDQPEVGQFRLSLGDGHYVAFFDGLGFRKRAINFEIGLSGWTGLKVAMVMEGSSDKDPSPVALAPGK